MSRRIQYLPYPWHLERVTKGHMQK